MVILVTLPGTAAVESRQMRDTKAQPPKRCSEVHPNYVAHVTATLRSTDAPGAHLASMGQVRIPQDDAVPCGSWPEVLPPVRQQLLPVIVSAFLSPNDGHPKVSQTLHIVA